MTDLHLHTDGNGTAGMLSQILAVDTTSMMRTCHSCGEHHTIARHRAYRGAAVVLRCPGCDDVAVRVGEDEKGVTVEWWGVFRIEQ